MNIRLFRYVVENFHSKDDTSSSQLLSMNSAICRSNQDYCQWPTENHYWIMDIHISLHLF